MTKPATKTALLIIDLQNDYFPNGKWELEGTEAAAAKAADLLAAFRKQGLPIVHVRHEFPTSDAPFFAPNTPGSEIHTTVQPNEGESVVLKHQINCFRETNLKEVLDEQGVETVLICGAMSHMCVDAATRAANDFGYQCTVAHDACATLALEFNGTAVPANLVHAAFMAALDFGYARVASTEELLAELK
ncbi:cysteine hydrolase family protein [Thalassoglobus sp.]|uniref:cysteine hydrolase family protein n=1 Tax=Thalassoglobus sp. TaxID=2795869 RepID=UPI003AA92F04